MDGILEFYAPLAAMSLVVALAVGLLGLLVWSVVWAYHDAERRGKPGWAVALLVLLLDWPLSLVLWLVFRPQLPASGELKH